MESTMGDVKPLINEQSVDVRKEIEYNGKVEESFFSTKRPDIYDLFGEFEMAKYKYSDEIRKIINKVARLEKTPGVTRYLTELHEYYRTLNYVPANLYQNIELKK